MDSYMFCDLNRKIVREGNKENYKLVQIQNVTNKRMVH